MASQWQTCNRFKFFVAHGATCAGGCSLNAECVEDKCQCKEGFSGDPEQRCKGNVICYYHIINPKNHWYGQSSMQNSVSVYCTSRSYRRWWICWNLQWSERLRHTWKYFHVWYIFHRAIGTYVYGNISIQLYGNTSAHDFMCLKI